MAAAIFLRMTTHFWSDQLCLSQIVSKSRSNVGVLPYKQ